MRLLREVLHFILHFIVDEWEFAIDLNALLKKRIVSIKVGLSPSKKNGVICLIESPLKMMKNAFYFILKVLSFSTHI